MRSMALVALVVSVCVITASTAGVQQPAPTSITIEELANRIRQSESGLTARMRTYKPIVEVYVQTVEPHEQLGSVPVKDEYFLGQFEWDSVAGAQLKRLTPDKGTRQQMAEWLAHPFSTQLKPEAFAAMTVPDWRWINAERYQFKYLRREFLGEVRCLVLDIQPKGDPRDGFTGRIWVEDRDFNIVRFNGITRNLTGGKLYFNVDSWRANVFAGMWLPSYVYAEQGSDDSRDGPKMKSQVRLWGYELKGMIPEQVYTTIQLDDPAVTDASAQPQQLSPTLSQRMWDQQAEENVLERLSKAGLLAPPGEVDKVLETVATNLLITNNLTNETGIHARVLLTSPLESFTVGRTLVLSRGLIDVLPDEASLATMLAHELAHLVLGHKVIDTKFAFADKLMVPDDELLATVRYRHSDSEEEAADVRMIDLLKNSPYKDKLAEAGLFLRAISENSKRLKNLIQPHIGEQMNPVGQMSRLTELIQKSPALSPERVDQIAALPLGARIVVNPWSGHVTLLRAPTVPLASAREKASLAVTPLVPYLRYAPAKP